MLTRLLCLFVLSLSLTAPAFAAENPAPHTDLPDPDFHFNTFFVTRYGLDTEKFDEFLRTARPQIVQIGYYGPQLHGYADNPKSTGYPMNLTMVGQKNLLELYKRLNARAHELDLKVVGHFQTGKVIGNWDKQDDFIDFYNNRWDVALLGPKPHPDVREVLARDATGEPIDRDRNATTRYVGLCVSSPHCRQMLKQMLKVALDTGLDGIMVNFNYRWSCVCGHCQASFKDYLSKKFTPAQIKEQFGIDDLAKHTFAKIDAEIPGFPAAGAEPIDWEARRWGAIQFKQAFDEIFLDYGRGLKPDLIIATWNHIGNVGVKEERMFLPADMWGKGENYFWYSGIYEGTDFSKRQCGDGWLLAAYIREMANGKPHIMGKYERIRMRLSVAEGVATGGGGMGRYHDYRDEAAFKSLSQYAQWLNAHQDLYWPKRSAAETALILPRQSVLGGDAKGYDAFRAVGMAMAENQVLFDVIADEKLAGSRLTKYAAVVVPSPASLTDAQRAMLRDYGQRGKLLMPADGQQLTAEQAVAELQKVPALSRFTAPWTVRAALWQQDDRLLVHLVNYLRDEAGGKARNRGPADERPLPQKDIAIDLRLPDNRQVSAVTILSPDGGEPQKLSFKQDAGRVNFTVPEMLVYSVVKIDLTPAAAAR